LQPEHLEAANGLVRCGSCLQVFDAVAHRPLAQLGNSQLGTTVDIDGELDAIEAQIDAITSKRAQKFAEQSNLHHDFDSDIVNHDMDNAEQTSQRQSRAPVNQPQPNQLLTSIGTHPKTDLGTDDVFDQAVDTAQNSFTNSQFQEEHTLGEDISSYDITAGKPEHFSTSDEFLEPDWSETSAIKPAAERMHSSASSLKRRSKLEEDIADFFAVTDTISHSGSGSSQFQNRTSLRPSERDGFSLAGSNNHGQAFDIQDEPLQVNGKKSRSGRYLLLGCMAIAALFFFGGSGYVSNQFENLSQDPSWRPWLARACALITCELPPTHHVRFLKAKGLNTQSIDGDLEVNTVIINTNEHFDMPFPTLTMEFSDLAGNLVAEFEVDPDEYRQGELRRLDSFPKNTSAHIVFRIPDPGEGAVNRALSFSY